MLKYCVDQWNKNKKNLLVAFEIKPFLSSDYKEFARIVIENIFPEWTDYQLDAKYYAEYQGEVVFFIHADPWTKEGLFLSYLSYGSCSVCDALLNAIDSYETRTDDLMAIALHFIQNMSHPYFSYDKKYNEQC